MKFLVQIDAIEAAIPPEAVAMQLELMVIPSLSMLADEEEKGNIIGGGVVVAQRSLAFIIEEDSNETLSKKLHELPFWGIMNTKVTPLAGIKEHLEYTQQDFKNIQNMMSGAEGEMGDQQMPDMPEMPEGQS